MSSTVLLASPKLQRLDTIEIEPAMVEGAQLFRPTVEAAFSDPRSHIVIDDAKSYFARGGARYDIVLSEPSNPWVSGVASLFSKEFYERLSHSLNDGGILCQWLHTYEMDDATIATIFEAVSTTFPNFRVYTSIDSDIVLIARKGGPVGDFDESVLQLPAIRSMAARLGLAEPGAVLRRSMGSSAAVLALFTYPGARVNSDYYPVVDQRSSRTRYTRAQVTGLLGLQSSPLPLLEMLDGTQHPSDHPVLAGMQADTDFSAYEGWLVHDRLLGHSRPFNGQPRVAVALRDARIVEAWARTCPPSYVFPEVLPSLGGVAASMNAHIGKDSATQVWKEVERSACVKTLDPLGREWIALFAAVAQRDAEGMSQHGHVILDASRGVKNVLTEYVFLATVTGEVCLGRRDASEKLFAEGPANWIDPGGHVAELRYLYVISHGPLPKAPVPGRCVTVPD
jgi:spermidine synthase